MGTGELDINIITRMTLDTITSNKGKVASYAISYFVWNLIFILIIGTFAISLFFIGFIGGLEFASKVLPDTSIGGPEIGLGLALILLLLALIFIFFIAMIMFLFAAPILFGGLARVWNKMVEGGPVRFLDFWRSGRRNYWRTIGIIIVMGMIANIISSIVRSPISGISGFLHPWDDVVMTPFSIATSAFLMISILTPLLIEEIERKNFADTLSRTFKIFQRSWKILLKLLAWIVVIISIPIMILKVIGILLVSSPYVALPLNLILTLLSTIFISIFLNHLIRFCHDETVIPE